MRMFPLLALGLLAASPALAQSNQPADHPAAGALPHVEWLAECARRLNATPGADPALTPGACQSWWAYYQGGGAPHPTDGYVMPVSVTETTQECTQEVITHSRIIKRRPRHDKRVAI